MNPKRFVLEKLEVKSFITKLTTGRQKRFVGGTESLEDTSCVSGDITAPTYCPCIAETNNCGKG